MKLITDEPYCHDTFRRLNCIEPALCKPNCQACAYEKGILDQLKFCEKEHKKVVGEIFEKFKRLLVSLPTADFAFYCVKNDEFEELKQKYLGG